MTSSNERLLDALNAIDPKALNYQEWVNVGMCLKEAGIDCAVWDSWSMSDGRYHSGECERKWETFNGDGLTGGTIIAMAKEHGWTPPASRNTSFGWDDEISYEGEPQKVNPQWVERVELPHNNMSPIEQLRTYLKTLFNDDDIIGYNTESWKADDGKYKPSSAGSYTRTAGDIIAALDRYGSIGMALGDYDENAGAWIRFNPLNGSGAKNENVAEFRYALVESDNSSIDDQYNAYVRMQLPIACLVSSGGKSLHAIVRVDAQDMAEYKQRVDFLYKACEENGLTIDKQNKNPSRLSRMPGVLRNGNMQELIAVNIGKRDWTEWKDYIGAPDENDNLPDIKNFGDVIDDLPELAPELIRGVLRQGHKMLISGPSKAGKSFALVELAEAIASGSTWMGFQCVKGRVLYINLEIDERSFLHRLDDVCACLAYNKSDMANIDYWSMRGCTKTLKDLVPPLIKRARNNGYLAVIVDPIYKVITGDENSAGDMAEFCNYFDRICTELGCAAIYVHHHSKGSQGYKSSIDRASGSGVFARDPDAIIDMLELEIPRAKDEPLEDDSVIGVSQMTAWRITGTLREFAGFRPVNVFFDYPIHRVDTDHILDNAPPKGSKESNVYGKGKATGTPEERADGRYDQLVKAWTQTKDKHDMASVRDMANAAGVTQKTVQNWLNEFSDYFDQSGTMYCCTAANIITKN